MSRHRQPPRTRKLLPDTSPDGLHYLHSQRTWIGTLLEFLPSELFIEIGSYCPSTYRPSLKKNYKFKWRVGDWSRDQFVTSQGSSHHYYYHPMDLMTQLSYFSMVAVDPKTGNIFVPDLRERCLKIYQANSIGIGTVGYPSFKSHTCALAFNNLGKLVIRGDPFIVTYDVSNPLHLKSERKFTFSPGAEPRYGESGIMSLAIDLRNNDIVTADSSTSKIHIFSSEGKLRSCFDCLLPPRGLAVDPLGNYYTTAEDKVYIFSPSGDLIRQFGKSPRDVSYHYMSEGVFVGAWGLAVDSNGLIIVADCGNHRLQVFTNHGKFLTQLGSEGKKQGTLRFPQNPVIGPKGEIIFMDYDNARVQMFVPVNERGVDQS